MPEVLELLDPQEVRQLPPNRDPWSERARRYVAAMQDDGVQAFVANADAEIRLLKAGDSQLPAVMVGRTSERWRCEACSPTSHFLHYSAEEALRRNPGLNEAQVRLARAPLQLLFEWGGGEKAVYINEWLWATSPPMLWQRLPGIAQQAERVFPGHAMVFRGLLHGVDKASLDSVRKAGFRLVPSRTVFLLNTTESGYRRPSNIKKDLKLQRKTGYRVIRERSELLPQAGRLAELYTQLYTGKYSRLNQQYNAQYMRLVIENEIAEVFGISKDGRIDGFFALFERNGMVGGPFIGYDRSLPRETGVYRQIFASLVEEAERRNRIVNLSSGVGEFKQLRGARPVREYWAIYDKHLPVTRRLPWQALTSFQALQTWRQTRAAQ